MDDITGKIRLVILKKPYDSYKDSEVTRNFLGEIFKLKLDGYTHHYPYGILPISDIDFIADHIIICSENKNKELEPLSGFKSVKGATCKRFNLPFPIVGHKFGLQADQFKDYVDSINCWISEREAREEEYAYNASWTIKPGLSKELRAFVRELTYSLVCLYYTTENIEYMINSTAALHGVNINEEKLGMHYLKNSKGEKFSSFKSPTFFDQPFFIMHTLSGGFKEAIIRCPVEFKKLWEERIVIGEVGSIQEKIAA